jgi:hypothetical protein
VSPVRQAWPCLVAVAVVALYQCTPVRFVELGEIDRVRQTPAALEGARFAPEVYARAERERTGAAAAHAAGDDVAATLHAERSLAAYGHALVLAREARAAVELADAQKALADAMEQEQQAEVSRASIEREAAELDEKLQITRLHLAPALSRAASAEREAARGIATRSLRVEARLLCAAARLVAPQADGLAQAQGRVDALFAKQGKASANGSSAPIDDAGQARVGCLDVLTRARREDRTGHVASDELLSELSTAGGWDPSADERGVIVTLRQAFRGADLTPDMTEKLKALGHIAATHPAFCVQEVLHDAWAPAAKADAARADAVRHALVGGGADDAHLDAELAGDSVPVADARDPARNERLDIVFVER